MTDRPSTLRDLLTVEKVGDDLFEGHSLNYPWGRVYGGQAVAQGLWAAGQTVEPQFLPHSMHAYFIRGGSIDVPIRYEVDELRDGRSFVTRRVVGRQQDKAIINISASFQVAEDAAEVVRVSRPDVEGPDGLESEDWDMFIDHRDVPVSDMGRARAWMRPSEDVDASPLLQAASIAFLSDDIATEAVVRLHPSMTKGRAAMLEMAAFREKFFTTSLDHAVWFHRLDRASEWTLHDFACDILTGSRGISRGHIFRHDGELVATVAQEVLLREIRR